MLFTEITRAAVLLCCVNNKKKCSASAFCACTVLRIALYSLHAKQEEQLAMQYAIVNFTTQQTQFYATFALASAAITAYNVQPSHTVVIVDLQENAVEQL